MDVQKFQRAPLTFFGTMRLTGDFKKIQKKFRKFFPHAGTVEENTLTLLSPFAIFEP